MSLGFTTTFERLTQNIVPTYISYCRCGQLRAIIANYYEQKIEALHHNIRRWYKILQSFNHSRSILYVLSWVHYADYFRLAQTPFFLKSLIRSSSISNNPMSTGSSGKNIASYGSPGFSLVPTQPFNNFKYFLATMR